MTPREIYRELEKFNSTDMILVNDEVIIENKDLNDDWFELSEYAEDEETNEDFNFILVNRIDFEENYDNFETEDCIYRTEFVQPTGCITRYNVLEVVEK